jgi:HK97 gp10 family phage protein
MSVVWEGLDAWIAKVSSMQERVPEQADAIMAEIGADAKEVMDSNTPVWQGPPDEDHHPGRLKEGNTLTPTESGFELSNATQSDRGAPYNIFVEEGTRHMAAEPYLQPATEFAAQAMEERLPRALE